jgi:hypothetical protein
MSMTCATATRGAPGLDYDFPFLELYYYFPSTEESPSQKSMEMLRLHFEPIPGIPLFPVVTTIMQ